MCGKAKPGASEPTHVTPELRKCSRTKSGTAAAVQAPGRVSTKMFWASIRLSERFPRLTGDAIISSTGAYYVPCLTSICARYAFSD